VEVFNLFDGELELDQEREGFGWRGTRVGDRLGAAHLGGSVYELAAGQRSFPYHFHHGVEEWLLVLSGAPTLREPAGERELRPGDVLCFPEGPEGAHLLENRQTTTARVLVLSCGGPVSVSRYPDSGKVGPRAGSFRPNFRESDGVDYWDGEA
jgi:uncharacterized cupin superfamily protein